MQKIINIPYFDTVIFKEKETIVAIWLFLCFFDFIINIIGTASSYYNR